MLACLCNVFQILWHKLFKLRIAVYVSLISHLANTMVGTFEVLKSISNKLSTHPECLKWPSTGKTTDLNAWLRNVHFEHFTSMDCEGKYENMFLFDGFLLQVILALRTNEVYWQPKAGH